MADLKNTAKLRLSYEKGSQTLSQCKLTAKDTELTAVANAIISLRKDKTAEVSKIMESGIAL